MPTKWKYPAAQIAAACLAITIFWFDTFAIYDIAISIFYLAVLALVAIGGSETRLKWSCVGCLFLAAASWVIVHRADTDWESALRLAFASVAIIVTTALLINHRKLQKLRMRLEQSQEEVLLFANSVPNLLWRADANAKIEFFNKRFDEIIGRDGAETVALNSYHEVIHPEDLPAYLAKLEALAQGSTDFRLTCRVLTADGSYRWMVLQARPILSEKTGAVLNWYGGALDIHEEVLAREELQRVRSELEASRAELQNFADSVPQILCRLRVDGYIEFFNRRYTELTGHDREEAIARQNWTDRFHPDDLGLLSVEMTRALEAGDGLRVAFRMLHADGEYRWMSLAGRAVRDQQTGEITGLYGGISDVHQETLGQRELERLRAELEESKAELVNFMDSVPQILWRATRDAYVDRYNARFDEVVGRDGHEVIAKQDWLSDFHPDDQEWFMDRIRKTFAAGEELNATLRLRHADGNYRWIALLGRPVFGADGKVHRYYGGTSDIHDEVTAREELQRTREALEESRAKVEQFANSVPYILWRSSPEGVILYFNERWTEVTGIPREEALVDFRYLETVHPEDRQGLAETITTAIAENAVSDATVRVRQADGSYRWMRLYDQPTISPVTGEIVRFGGASDVQAMVEMQAEIKELNETLEQRVAQRSAELLRTEARYSSLFEVSNMTFGETDFSDVQPVIERLRSEGVTSLSDHLEANPDTVSELVAMVRIARVNQAALKLLGYESEDALKAAPAAKLVNDCDFFLRQFEMIFDGIDHIDGRTTLVHRDGHIIPCYFTVSRITDGLHISSMLDMSEQEQIEAMRRGVQDELARANRVATVGAFSASIAHELNQPITSIVMDVQTGLRWLQRQKPDTAAAERILERLSRTAERVSGIVQRTRENILSGRRKLQSVKLCNLARETCDLLAPDMRRSAITLELKCDGDIPAVQGDAIDLQQVLVNLINNAADAMREQSGRKNITLSINTGEGSVQVEVADTGPGIPEEHLGRLFEPFFTTKNEGIGMGLQICRSAVEALGGDLSVENKAEGGARFTFTLPIAMEVSTV